MLQQLKVYNSKQQKKQKQKQFFIEEKARDKRRNYKGAWFLKDVAIGLEWFKRISFKKISSIKPSFE